VEKSATGVQEKLGFKLAKGDDGLKTCFLYEEFNQEYGCSASSTPTYTLYNSGEETSRKDVTQTKNKPKRTKNKRKTTTCQDGYLHMRSGKMHLERNN